MRSGLALVACVLTVLAACGDSGPPTVDATSPAPTTPPSTTASPSPTLPTGCEETEFPSLQEGGHLLEGTDPPVPYSSTPGTSGWHAGGAPRTGVFGADEELSEPHIVLALEIGQIVASYDPAGLGADAVSELEQLATTQYPDALTVTPFTARDQGTALVLSGWGVRMACHDVDPEAISSFVETHLSSAPGHG